MTKKNFTIIKNSESSTGYNIPDVEFKGLLDGYVCGWQFEYLGDDNKLYYGSCAYEACMPEQYAYRWMDGELSWLEEFTQHNARLTGRVIFRGYAVTRWDPEEHDEYVVDVEFAEDGSPLYVMSTNNYNSLLGCISGYDHYTSYIENGRQQLSAERHNSELVERFKNIAGMTGYGEFQFPYITGDSMEALDTQLRAWLRERNIVVEQKLPEKTEEPKPTKRVWTEDEIKHLVQTNDKVLYGALKNLYNCQTSDEKTCEHTSHQNGAGFNKVDAQVLTSITEFLIKTGFLTSKQKELVRKKLVKYTGQLTRLANA